MILSNYPKIDLHGFDRDYASIMVKDFIKDNYIIGNKSIVIIHGKGTGILRQRIHSDLKRNKLVESYQWNMVNDGETIVRLRTKSWQNKEKSV